VTRFGVAIGNTFDLSLDRSLVLVVALVLLVVLAKRWQARFLEEPRKQAKTVATHCDWLL
jgi:hypothetical protein